MTPIELALAIGLGGTFAIVAGGLIKRSLEGWLSTRYMDRLSAGWKAARESQATPTT